MGASVVDRFRQPEYTGENRCIPCTVVNTVIAVVVAGAVGAGAAAANLGTTVAAGAGAAVLVVSLAAIYLRGYLVPYTPQLTKRYFPERVLAWFDKAPEAQQGGLGTVEEAADVDAAADAGEDAPVAGSEGQLDPEPVLLDAGAIEICEGGEDLCPTESFTAAWREEITALRDGGDLEGRVAEAVGADDIEIDDHDEFVLVRADNRAVARWESRAALLADMGAYPLLADRVDGWADLGRQEQGSLLNGARVFLEQCPDCDGTVAFSQETVESCCRSVDVVALSCESCEARILEVET